MDQSKEWGMVVELMEFVNEIESDKAADFIENLYQNLDPYAPFEDQMQGDVEKQRKWLYSLFERYVNEDPEAAAEIYEED